ncbi:MAG TPA: hypothetical protein VNQ77_12605 [Frankiaceae bacterium]|nr:hypothetical protein [Frankiaceae bacterium]
MRPRRVLALRAETLGELTTEELTGIAGAAIPTAPIVACVSRELNCAIYDPHSIVCQVVSERVC